MNSSLNNIALYIHWPFCKSKCPYCDFNSHVGGKIDEAEWLKAYFNELDYFSPIKLPSMVGKKISTIFFGGGTPSLMPATITESLINKARETFGFTDDIEITLEANPTSIEASKFRDFKAAGINRVSIGVQSLNHDDLKFLGREHSAEEAIKALEVAANTFDNYSFDLIYARPEQSAVSWQKELEKALSFGTKHLSLYQLTIEKGTRFYADYHAKQFEIPNSDKATELYELTNQIMQSHGMPAYEVSNYAKHGYECRHNLNYWHYNEYIGIGAGAHGRLAVPQANGQGRRATMMLHSPDNWLKSALEKNVGLQTDIVLDEQEIFEEFIMMNLRLLSGIKLSRFNELFGKPYDQMLNMENLRYLLDEGLLELDLKNNILKVTKQGLLLIQAIIPKLTENA